MTSQIRRHLALKIPTILSTNKVINYDCFASVIYPHIQKGCLPEFHLLLDELRNICRSNDVRRLHQLPMKSAKIEYDTMPSLAEDIDKDVIKEVLSSIFNNSSNLWKSNVHLQHIKPETVVVEFSSPNIAKPFHAGHLRSTILGNFISNVHQAVGHNVIRVNYLGDWGSQFGVLAKGYQIFGNDVLLEENSIQHLFEVYVKTNEKLKKDANFEADTREEFKQLENGKEPVTSLWKKFRELSIAELKKTYLRLGINFDFYEGESNYSKDAIELCTILKNTGLLINKDDGTQVVEHDHPGGLRNAMMRKSDGTTLYLTRDISAAIKRQEKYHFGKMFYVVENGQSDHFIALFEILKRMDFSWHKKLSHIKFGRIHGMSTRQGKVVFLKAILDEAQSRAATAMQKSPNTRAEENFEYVADVLGISAVLINDMQCRRLNDFDFSWERIMRMKGDSGISLQYVHARLCSLEENCGVSRSSHEDCDFNLLNEIEAKNLISILARYPHVCSLAYNELEPCHIVKFLFKLGHAINGAFKYLKIKDEVEDIAKARLMLFIAARYVLADGMRIVGLTPLKKM